MGIAWGESYSRWYDVHAAGGQCTWATVIMQLNSMGMGVHIASGAYKSPKLEQLRYVWNIAAC